jgi:hypothetical protein
MRGESIEAGTELGFTNSPSVQSDEFFDDGYHFRYDESHCESQYLSTEDPFLISRPVSCKLMIVPIEEDSKGRFCSDSHE